MLNYIKQMQERTNAMKLFKKILATAIISILALSTITSCGAGDDGDERTVSSNEVISQSIAKIEEMMEIGGNSETQLTAFIPPNRNVDYENERLSILRGSGSALYFTQYLSNPDLKFDDNAIYRDTISEEGMTLNIYVQKNDFDDGVQVNLENHQSYGDETAVFGIQIYFEYDYSEKKPIKTTIVAITEEYDYSVALAQFDYETNLAYSYNFSVSAQGVATVKSALSQKELDFQTLCTAGATEYLFAKLNPSNKTIESYAYYDSAADEITATESDVSALYSSVYAEVKDACVSVPALDVATATQKAYYRDMYTYAMSKISTIQ